MKLKLFVLWPILVLGLSVIIPERTFAYYDPGVQRWITRDPAWDIAFENQRSISGPNFQGSAGLNLHSFTDNRPVGFVDTFGLAYGNPVPPCAPYPDCLKFPPPPLPPMTCKERENRCRARAAVLCGMACVVTETGPVGWGVCMAIFIEFCHQKYHDSCVDGRVLEPFDEGGIL